MVICCVPNCGADSWKCDGSITFYDFPSNPDLSAKWIKQINTAVKTRPMWFPRGKPVICSKHFLHTDFKGDTDSLKPRCVPTVFGHKYIGPNPEDHETNQLPETKKSPMIVKVIRPETTVLSSDSSLRISDVRSESNSYENAESPAEIIQIDNNSNSEHSTTHENINLSSNHPPTANTYSKASNFKSVVPETSQQKNISTADDISSKSVLTMMYNRIACGKETIPVSTPNSVKITQPTTVNIAPRTSAKKITKKREKSNSNELIEIGPNTFLKINPDIIKVNKKLTPSGNTVLQFLMDQKHAKNFSSDQLPRLIQGLPTSSVLGNDNSESNVVNESIENTKNKDPITSNQQNETVQRVLGHVVDTHVCEKSCANLQLPNDDDDIIMIDETNNCNNDNNSNTASTENPVSESNIVSKPKNGNIKKNPATSCIDKAPVLFTTNMPLSHCFIDKPKYILQLKQKTRQIASLKFKVNALNKKIEELEDRCIVQERQLSYSFIKRLKSIRKNASKGDPCATYILEQIRSYSNNSKMRWSDSTLTQCAIWCRKAPYAYEYFKKADFFKLPCLGTVKRFIKKHPELKFQKKVANSNGPQNDANGEDDESSSDFDFDDSEAENNANNMSEDENNVGNSGMLSSANGQNKSTGNENNEVVKATESISGHQLEPNLRKNDSDQNNQEKITSELIHGDENTITTTLDTSNLELQEIMLPSGEVVQCYSAIGSTDAGSNQYYIIPNVSEQNNSADHEYSVVPTDQLPIVLQNIDTSRLRVENQEQLIFIANSSGQVECNETEVTSA